MRYVRSYRRLNESPRETYDLDIGEGPHFDTSRERDLYEEVEGARRKSFKKIKHYNPEDQLR